MNKVMKYINTYKSSFKEEMIWDVAIRFFNGNDNEWKIVETEGSRYWLADPFIFNYKGNKNYVFYEKYDRKKEIGHLSCREIYNDLNLGKEFTVLKRPYHLSFPNIFNYNDNIYLIPETSNNHSIEIYKCISFPEKWELYKIIKQDVIAADTIIYDVDDTNIYILTSITSKNACDVKAVLMKLDKDFNYISEVVYKESSEYGNRNAGNIINRVGKKIRVGQDCTNNSYGKGLVFFEISDSIEKEIKYINVKNFTNSNKYSGVHTYNQCSGIETVDLRYFIKRNIITKIRLLVKLGGNYVKRRI